MNRISSSCGSVTYSNYYEFDNTTCVPESTNCTLMRYAWMGASQNFTSSDILVSVSSANVFCNASDITVFDTFGDFYEQTSLVPSLVPNSCQASIPIFSEEEPFTTYVSLRNLIPPDQQTQIAIRAVGPIFSLEPLLFNNYMSFALNYTSNPSLSCCQLPQTILASLHNSTCFNSTIPFTIFEENVYVAETSLLPHCAYHVGSNAYGTFFSYTISINNSFAASPNCFGIESLSISQLYLVNLTQFVPFTNSPTLNTPAPTTISNNFKGSVYDVGAFPSNLCPVTVSGFTLPYAIVNYTALYNHTLTQVELNPSYQFVADVAASSVAQYNMTPSIIFYGKHYNTTSSTTSWMLTQTNECVATQKMSNGKCQLVQLDVQSSARAFVDGVWLGAAINQNFLNATVPCPNATTCSNSSTVKAAATITLLSSVQYSAQNPVTVDIHVTSTMNKTQWVAIDTVRVNILDSSGNLAYSNDISKTYKQLQVHNTLSPYYYDGHFCRGTKPLGLFYSPAGVWNSWIASNIQSFNSTLCVYASDLTRDRVMFTPSYWSLGNYQQTSGTMQVSVTYVIYDSTSSQTPCYTAPNTKEAFQTNGSPTQPITGPSLPLLASVAAVGIGATVAVAAGVASCLAPVLATVIPLLGCICTCGFYKRDYLRKKWFKQNKNKNNRSTR